MLSKQGSLASRILRVCVQRVVLISFIKDTQSGQTDASEAPDGPSLKERQRYQ